MLVGLQGSGKTTAAAKLGLPPQEARASSPLLAACDVYRPAAADQLEIARQARSASRVFRRRRRRTRWRIAESGDQRRHRIPARRRHRGHGGPPARRRADDGGGPAPSSRRRPARPDPHGRRRHDRPGRRSTWRQAFAERVDFDGVIMSKMDGDARGGARAFHPRGHGQAHQVHQRRREARARSRSSIPTAWPRRILGMGDMLCAHRVRREGAAGRGREGRDRASHEKPAQPQRLRHHEPPDPQDGRRVEAYRGPARRRQGHSAKARWTRARSTAWRSSSTP